MIDRPLWQAVDSLVDRAPRLSDLSAHGLQLLAARRYRERGLPLPAALTAAWHISAIKSLAVKPLLERARDVCDGPLVVMKGPELAARYPDPLLRPFGDVDLLVPDAAATHAALLDAGFQLTGDPALYVGIHHLRPLHIPGLPLVIEVHSRPKWIDRLTPPSTAELIADAVPAACEVDGVLALAPAHHVLAVAAHSWAHRPLGKLLHLIDVAALLEHEADPADVGELARRWDLGRLWRTTSAAVDWALYGDTPPRPVSSWARNLLAVRERTVLESHIERCTAAFWALPPRRAAAVALAAMHDAARPEAGEPAGVKLRRTGRALRDAFARLSDHQLSLDRSPASSRDHAR